MQKQVAVIGSKGYVGSAHVDFFNMHYNVVTYDLDHGDKDECRASDLVAVCVPTPESETGACDISIVEEVLTWLVDTREDEPPLIVIKSTVPPGTTKSWANKFNHPLVFSPEFIGESSYASTWVFEKEIKKTPWFIFGGAEIDGSKAANRVCDFYVPITGPQPRYLMTDSSTAEMAKYWENCYFSSKVTFANEIKNICDAFGVNFIEARDLFSADPRVDVMHTMVFPDSPGFGGKCFPKDLAALIAAAEDAGYDPEFLCAIRDSNTRFRSR